MTFKQPSLLRLTKTFWMSSSTPLVPNQKALTRTAARGPPVICSKSISCWHWIQITTMTQIKLQCIFRLKQLNCQGSETQPLICGNKRRHFSPLRLCYKLLLSLKMFIVTCVRTNRLLKNNAKIMKLPAVRVLFMYLWNFIWHFYVFSKINTVTKETIYQQWLNYMREKNSGNEQPCVLIKSPWGWTLIGLRWGHTRHFQRPDSSHLWTVFTNCHRFTNVWQCGRSKQVSRLWETHWRFWQWTDLHIVLKQTQAATSNLHLKRTRLPGWRGMGHGGEWTSGKAVVTCLPRLWQKVDLKTKDRNLYTSQFSN